MLKKLSLLFNLFSLLFCGLAPTAHAQEAKNKLPYSDQESSPKDKIWIATIPGGQYIVSLNTITSLAKQSYILDNNLVIYELTIETLGSALARFYYVEPFIEGKNISLLNSGKQKATEITEKIAERLGDAEDVITLQNSVVKQYPTTSHAKTIEFRLPSKSAINSLYSSVSNAWISGIGRRYHWK